MAEPAKLSPVAKLVINLGPLLLFFAGARLGRGLFAGGALAGPGMADADTASALVGTAVFMLASLVAAAWSWRRTRHLPPAMLFNLGVVVLFGGLTLWFQDKAFIQLKPSIIYAGFCLILLFGLATRRPTLQLVLEDAFPSLTPQGWRLLTRNWAGFFALLLLANEAARRSLSFDDWLNFKVWGVTVAIFLFTLTQGPLLRRHGGMDAD
jgi:intracellular septation protein